MAMMANPDRQARLPDSTPSVPGTYRAPAPRVPVRPKPKPRPRPVVDPGGGPGDGPTKKPIRIPADQPTYKPRPKPKPKPKPAPVKKPAPKAPAKKPAAPKVPTRPAPAPAPRPVTPSPAIPRPPAPGMPPGGPGPAPGAPGGPGGTPTPPRPTPQPAPPPPPRWGAAPGARGLGLDLSQFGASTQDVSGLMGGAGRTQVRDTRGPSGLYAGRGGGDHDAEVAQPQATVAGIGYDPGRMLGLNRQAAQEMSGGLVSSAAGKANAYAQALADAQAKFAQSVGGAKVTPYDPNVDPTVAAQLADQSYAGPQDLSEVTDFNALAQAALEAERTADLAGDTGGIMQLLSDTYGQGVSAEDAALARMYGGAGLGTIASGYGDATGMLSDVFDQSRQVAAGAQGAIAQEAHKYATQPTSPLPPLPVPEAPPVAAPPVAAPPVVPAKPAAPPKPKAPAPKKPAAKKPPPKPVTVKKSPTKKPAPAPKKKPAPKRPAPAPAQKTPPRAPSQAPSKPVYSPPAGTGINEPGDGSYRKPRRFPFL